jgi:hydroxyacylglutathione hydrolase
VPGLLGREKRSNPFLRADDPDVAKHVGLPGASPAQVFTEVRERKNNFRG